VKSDTEMQQLEVEKQRRHVTSVERIGVRKGTAKGMAKRRIKLLNLQTQQRLEELPGRVEARLWQAAPEEGATRGVRVLSAGSLEEIFGVNSESDRRPL
jgi:hypothetical protein